MFISAKKELFLAVFYKICGIFIQNQLTGIFSLRSLGLC